MIVRAYHGSPNNYIERFSLGYCKSEPVPAIYFTDNIKIALTYGKYIYDVDLRLRDTKVMDYNGGSFHDDIDRFDVMVKEAYASCCDALIVKNFRDPKYWNNYDPLSTVYVVFESNCISIREIEEYKTPYNISESIYRVNSW